ncbi:MAG: phospholipase [Runella slithyformis]|jgi:predicted esterase|nr:MAG: phospholipase [Runella sp.]TAG24883.1 MAG: phospholipase [Cytophagales bacterium]TAG36813.1 MAG: phospholipase [Cytophagia bacterium]TAG56569.1 MAG: phospholipase [Runella slithyformis]TAG84377.1 MAG: phospholipase [Cytophagales bacterium]
MKENRLSVSRTARYCTIGEWNANTRHVWFVLHGYGQLAQYFIRKFEVLNDGQTLVVAPEALSRFYLSEFAGRVGASWMTRDDRLAEIDDYVAYLNQLYDTVKGSNNAENVQVHLLGFSQGTATAARWLANKHLKCDRLVLWAGYFANGLADVVDAEQVKQLQTVVVYGNKDEFLSEIDLEKYQNDILDVIPHAQIVCFDGPHAIDVETLKKIAKP